ncbi:hypothetical protein AK812_SmicGene30801 [Symbiodinium microadriaticum]|uniref:Uncharacterized protein n=1 Tax=Symbiodinium microadriaticum TaxID=2951 RepID=A0A1Q9CYD7_SYMMI|nr:hypothetical protein AK812_SmicGene30801 [Symbiodinium microadriaticum]
MVVVVVVGLSQNINVLSNVCLVVVVVVGRVQAAEADQLCGVVVVVVVAPCHAWQVAAATFSQWTLDIRNPLSTVRRVSFEMVVVVVVAPAASTRCSVRTHAELVVVVVVAKMTAQHGEQDTRLYVASPGALLAHATLFEGTGLVVVVVVDNLLLLPTPQLEPMVVVVVVEAASQNLR